MHADKCVVKNVKSLETREVLEYCSG